jgi:hypothetical protein
LGGFCVESIVWFAKMLASTNNIMNQSPPVSAPLQSCGLATWSLVLGIAAIVLCIVCIGPLLGIPAVICGHIALGRIKRANGTMKGHGPAIGGLVTGYISIALIPVIGLLSAIAIPNFVKARQTAQMNACIHNLVLIDSAKAQWALEKGKDSGATPSQADIAPYLGGDQKMPICPAGGTYQINAASNAPTCTIPEHELIR